MPVERNMIIKEYFNSMEYVYCLSIFEYLFIYRKSTFKGMGKEMNVNIVFFCDFLEADRILS